MGSRQGNRAVHLLLLAALAAVVPACGDGGGSGGGGVPSATGVFVDAPVAGLAYVTSGGFSGTTAADGTYFYDEGDTVVFSIGDTDFPAVPAGPIVTPLTVFDTSDVNDVRVVNLARLLQTLDTDADPDNGITISPAAAVAATGVPPIDFSSGSFDTDTAVVSLLASGGGAGTLVSGVDAVAHLQSQILVGTWFILQAPGDHSTIAITFLSDGTYMLAEDGDPGVDPSGQDGMERGTYTWDSATAAFTATPTVDTNGEWGLSHPQGAVTVTIAGDVLTYTDDSGSTPFSRLVPDASAIVGSWGQILPPGQHSSFVITFFADGTYLMAEDGNSTIDPNGQDGMERGTYTWDSNTGAFTATAAGGADSNGEWGLDPDDPATVTIAGSTMTLDGSFDIQRFAP